MKIAVISDLHLGVHNDDPKFHDYFETFFSQVFFPYLSKNKIGKVIICGDGFNSRHHTNHYTISRSSEYLWSQFGIQNIKCDFILGNHDIFFKDKLSINSPKLLLNGYKNINVIMNPETHENIDYIPWICKDNYETVMEFLKNSNSKICFGHFQFSGFEMNKGFRIDEGLDHTENVFRKYDKIFSGHYHHSSTKGNVLYLGTPYQLTWDDVDDPKGFWIYDTDSFDMEFIENPYKMYAQLNFNPDLKKEIKNFKNTFVRINVDSHVTKSELDKIQDQASKIGAFECKIIENFTLSNGSEPDDYGKEVPQTINIIGEAADDLEIDDHLKAETKKYILSLYQRAIECV